MYMFCSACAIINLKHLCTQRLKLFLHVWQFELVILIFFLLFVFIGSALRTLKMLFIPKEILMLFPLAKEMLSFYFLKPLSMIQ